MVDALVGIPFFVQRQQLLQGGQFDLVSEQCSRMPSSIILYVMLIFNVRKRPRLMTTEASKYNLRLPGGLVVDAAKQQRQQWPHQPSSRPLQLSPHSSLHVQNQYH